MRIYILYAMEIFLEYITEIKVLGNEWAEYYSWNTDVK